MSTHDLDAALGTSPGYTSRLERFPRRPRSDTVEKLAKILGINVEWLTTGKGPMRPAAPGVERYPNRAEALRRHAREWHDRTVEHLRNTEWMSDEDPPVAEWVQLGYTLNGFYRRGAEPGEPLAGPDEELGAGLEGRRDKKK